jgi:rhamnulokinase
MVGGGALNEPLCRWTADAAGLPVLVGPVEATAVGNLVGQAIALGELGSLDDAREVVRASFDPVVYEPSPSAAWPEALERFEHLANGRREEVLA